MNVYDSTRMVDVLAPIGYEEIDNVADADLVILNTCHIREKAAEKIYSELGRIRREQTARASSARPLYIAVGGCVAQAEGEEIFRRAPYVDIVMGSHAYHELPQLLKAVENKQRHNIALDFPEVQKFDLLPKSTSTQGSSAFVAVQEGCDKFCTFCVVPYTRGAEYSRPAADIMREVRDLVENKGAIELTLVGQNVNAYHGNDESGNPISLAQLITSLAEINDLQAIRYITSHPRDMQDDLIQAHGDIPKLMPYLHLPIQAGSDAILKAMNRGHKASDYLEIIDKLRKIRPDIAFSSDFIIGFPGETEEDFQATLALSESVGYSSAYCFKYSPRPGTPAAEREDQVPEDVKEDRLKRMQIALNRQRDDFNQLCLGKEMDIILDRKGKRTNQLIGRSPYMQAVHVDNSTDLFGKKVRVRISEVHPMSLKGEVI